MNSPGQDDDLKKVVKTAVVIASSMLAVLFIYLVAVETIRARMAPFSGFVEIKNTMLLRYVFYGIAVFQVVLIRVLRGFLLKKIFSSEKINMSGDLFKTSTLILALSEIPAILGLALFLLAGLNRDFYILLFVSLFLMFMYFPRYNNWKTWVNEKDPSKCSICRP